MLGSSIFSPKNETERKPGRQGIALRLHKRVTFRDERQTTYRDASPSRGPSVFVQRRSLEPDRLPNVQRGLAFRHYGPLHAPARRRHRDYESTTKHAFGGDECNFGTYPTTCEH